MTGQTNETFIGIVGCGFVADYYLETLQSYPHLKIVGLADKVQARAEKLGKVWGHPVVSSYEELLSNPKIELILNLTNPRNHFEVSMQALQAGKHIYSEKPLAMDFNDAEKLVATAKEKGLHVSSAPCSILGETAQTMGRAIKKDMVGKVRVVYAEMDDGPVHLMKPEEWRSKSSGVPWPIKDEYEVGCTLEHAGYLIPWLAAFFGPATNVTAFASVLVPEKYPHGELSPEDTPDFTVACITFKSGVVARLTCSIMSPHDHSVRVIGEKGILSIDECWHYGDPVRLLEYSSLAFRAEKYRIFRNSKFFRWIFGLRPKALPFHSKPNGIKRLKRDYMDYARGVSDLAQAIKDNKTPTLSSQFSLHVNEISLAIHHIKDHGGTYKMKTDFPSTNFFED